MNRRTGALLVVAATLAGLITPTGRASSAETACGAAAMKPPVTVPGRGDLQVFAIQYRQLVGEMQSYQEIANYVGCPFAHEVAPLRDPAVPGLVVFNELTGIAFGLAGSRGAPARAFDRTPAATQAGKQTGEPLGALGGAIGLTAAAYAEPLAFYAARFPVPTAAELAGDVATLATGGTRIPADRAFLALTDTYVRAFVGTFSALARRFGVAVVAGAPMPVLTDASSCAANGYRGWAVCPGWKATSDPAAVAALADPDLAAAYAARRLTTVYEAVTPNITNAAFVFGPDGSITDVQPKVNLTPIELELGWTPAPSATIHAIAVPGQSGHPVPRARMGVAISLDAFEHGQSADPCAHAGDYVSCLSAKGANLLVQPEFNDGTARCPSWSTYSAACTRPPVWQPLDWMNSSWYDVEGRDAGGYLYPSFSYAVNAFMVGNLYDVSGDGQTAILARDDPRAIAGAYVGDTDAADYLTAGPYGPYPDPVSDRALDGPKPGFLGVAPWVLPGSDPDHGVRDVPSLAAGDPRSLASCENGLVPGSDVTRGPCAENAEVSTAVVAELRF